MTPTPTKTVADVQFRGIGVASGVAHGPALCRPRIEHNIIERKITAEDVPRELARFESALIATRRQLRHIQNNTDPAVAGIFDAHLLILDDRPFLEKILNGIQKEHHNVEFVLARATRDFTQSLAAVKDDYLRERIADVEDVVRRIQHHLSGSAHDTSPTPEHPCILIANDLTPSEIVTLDKTRILGLALDLGSPTSHSAILAGKIGIPTVVGLHDITAQVANGDEVLLDGNRGLVIIHPSPALLDKFDRIAETRRKIETGLLHLKDVPSETQDGFRMLLMANIEGPQDVEAVLAAGADGVGLFRTEFFFIARHNLPSEDEQFEAYRDIAARLAPRMLIIRSLDLGGDKFLPSLGMEWKESNPFMGWRAIRFCLSQPELFRTQLRAILRASVYGHVKLMYPMISNVEEILRANAILEQAKRELLASGYPFNPHLEVGAMIEVPAAAVIADRIAPHVKFFSLGTNDLVQYTLAIDRGNERVAYLYEPTHPAILRLIKNTVDAGHRHGIPTGLCGGLAGDPLMTPLLIGLGLNELSVNPASLPMIKDAILHMSYSESRDITEAALFSESFVDVQDMSRALAKKVAPEILELVE